MIDYGDSPFKATCVILEKYGIDPQWIAVEDLSTAGYYEYERENNQRVMGDNGYFKRNWRTWPSMSVAIEIVDQYVADWAELQKRQGKL